MTRTQFVRQLGQAEQTLRRLRWLNGMVVMAPMFVAAIVIGLVVFATSAAAQPPIMQPTLASALAWMLACFALMGWQAWMSREHRRQSLQDLPGIVRRLGALPLDTLGNPLERRLQNLLEELALSAHVGVPRGFVIDQAHAIDALTLGLDRNNTAVVVTRGALTRLTREELRGLLAHEIAHVVSGDVRTATYLIGMNRGLRRIAAIGWAWRAASPHRSLRRALGGVCFILGAPGVAAARLIETGLPAARDLHADALAASLAGHADGLGSVLRKLQGDHAPNEGPGASGPSAMPGDWYELGLIRFSAPRGWPDGCAANAPVSERIRRLGCTGAVSIVTSERDESPAHEPALPALDLTGATVGGQAGSPVASQRPRRVFLQGCEPALLQDDDVSQEPGSSTAVMRLMRATREPAGAAALAVALVTDAPRVAQTPGEQPAWGSLWLVAAQRHSAIQTALAELPDASLQALRWPLLELACARLRPLSLASRQSLMGLARGHAADAGHFAPRQWIHCVLLQRRLGLQPEGVRHPSFGEAMDARSVRVLCAILAQDADLGEVRADRAANAAIRALALPPIGGSSGALSLAALERAVELAACLPAIDRLTLIEHLRRLLPRQTDARCTEFLRLLCLTIDCPQVSPPAASGRVDTAQATAMRS